MDGGFEGVPTRFWTALDDGRVRCDVCPRECRMQDGQRGLCFVRGARGGEVVLTTWGRSSGFCVDPIEKKPLNHFLPGTPVLSLGTAGCNLACDFCQNWSISKSREVDTLADSGTPEAIAAAAQKLACRSVAYTYNDPAIFLEYALDIAAACRERGIASVAVTAGYMKPAAREALFAGMDAANVDLKAFSEQFYRRVAKGHLEPVKETLVYLKRETRVWFEITTLLIPGLNDGEAEISELAAWILEELGPDVPLHFTAFHPDHRMMDRPPTPHATLAMARRLALRRGLRHVYCGNVRDSARATTWCHACGTALIRRDAYAILAWNLGADGACPHCATPLPGVFEARPGGWGNRRLPVRLAEAAPQPSP
ncbi:MAG: AmmeMemoRadiSam system radical SAM enzyme [Thalassobaculales bacterium]